MKMYEYDFKILSEIRSGSLMAANYSYEDEKFMNMA